MRLLRPFRPRLIGSVMTGHVRKGSDIDLHVFTDSAGLVTDLLEQEGYQFDVERKQVVKHGEARVFTHIHVYDRFNFELTVYAEDKAHYVFKSSITGKAIERASIRELEELLAREYPGPRPGRRAGRRAEAAVDPYPIFRMLLLPLENVKQSPQYHPEGDVLYHSLQVFELARDAPALRRGVPAGGPAARRRQGDRPGRPRRGGAVGAGRPDHRADARSSSSTTWTPTTTAPARCRPKLRRELEASPDFEDLMLLRELDDAGRVPGAVVGTVDEALDYLKELERSNG